MNWKAVPIKSDGRRTGQNSSSPTHNCSSLLLANDEDRECSCRDGALRLRCSIYSRGNDNNGGRKIYLPCLCVEGHGLRAWLSINRRLGDVLVCGHLVDDSDVAFEFSAHLQPEKKVPAGQVAAKNNCKSVKLLTRMDFGEAQSAFWLLISLSH